METVYLIANFATGKVVEASAKEFNRIGMVMRIATEYWEKELGYGGMIVMSTDVNAMSGSGFINHVTSWAKTLYNRWVKNSKVTDTITDLLKSKNMETGFSIGNLFRGKYFNPKDKKAFDESSFAIDMRGVEMDFIKDLAKDLMRKFDQHSVLIVDHKTGRTTLFGQG